MFRFGTSLDNVCQNLIPKFNNYSPALLRLTKDIMQSATILRFFIHISSISGQGNSSVIGRGYPAVEVFQSVPPKLMNVWFHMEKRLDLMPFSAFVF